MWGSSIKGPDLEDLKATVQNLQVTLSGDEYINGMDQVTTIKMIGDLYSYIIGTLKHGLQLPAPAEDPCDKGRVIWPDGMKVKTRRGSLSSVGSGRYVKKDSRGNPVVGAGVYAGSRASSATSTSKYSSRYVGIAEEYEHDEPLPVRRTVSEHGQHGKQPSREHGDNLRSRKHVSYAQGNTQDLPVRPPKLTTGTHRLSGAALKPTPSMERFIDQHAVRDEGREESEEERRPVLKSTAPLRPKKGGFADED